MAVVEEQIVKPYHQTDRFSLYEGDCRSVLPTLEDNSVDSIVCDPPYGLEFMGKDWDAPWKYGITKFGFADNKFRKPAPQFQSSRNPMCRTCRKHKRGSKSHEKCVCESPDYDETEHRLSDMAKLQEWCYSWAIECLRVLKPGGHLLAFGGSRTYHRLACAIEDAGFEIRDQIQWIYGCLSDDTEILINGRWEPYHKAVKGSRVLCYNMDHDTYEWQPVQDLLVYQYSDTAYRIKSDSTDQIVSRNHRCIVERSGAYTFAVAEEVAREREARVPVLENVSAVLNALPLLDQRASHSEQDVFSIMHGEADLNRKDGENKTTFGTERPSDYLRRLSEEEMEVGHLTPQSESADVLIQLQRKTAGSNSHETQVRQDRNEVSGNGIKGRQEPGVEGRSYLLSETWELQADQVCAMPAGVLSDGPQRRICDGAPLVSGPSNRAVFTPSGDGSPRRSRSFQQRTNKLPAIRIEPRSQTVRASRFTRSALARITPFHYDGVVWCVRVPSGAFVARRNGKVFITGNSGFPKSLDVSKAIDAAAGAEREVIAFKGTAPDIRGNSSNGNGISSVASTLKDRIPNNITAPSTDAAKQWNGWGTALKPAHEPIVLARKPLIGTVAENVLQHGTGGLNIAACRVTPYDQRPDAGACTPRSQNGVLVDTSASVPSLLQNEFQRIAFALRSCSTGDTGPLRDEGGRDGKLLADVEYGSLRARLYPNGVWCGLTLTSVQDSPACCPSCRRSCDVLFHRVQECARESAASLADALVDTCREIPALVHNRECQSSARPSSCDVVPLFAAFLSRLLGGIIPDIQPSRVIDFGGDWYRSKQHALGRWPSNLIHDGSEEVLARFPETASGAMRPTHTDAPRSVYGQNVVGGYTTMETYGDSGSAARFFYCAKATQEDRNEGLEDLPVLTAGAVTDRKDGSAGLNSPRAGAGRTSGSRNSHPTVKPTDVMRYLCRLITPPGGIVLDPFCGSGSTGKAAMLEGFKFVGIELSADYCQLAQLRIEAVTRQGLLFA